MIPAPQFWQYQHNNKYLLSDDQIARRIAKENGVMISGTIGILWRCADKNIISFSEGNISLTKMIQNGYISPVHNLEDISPQTRGK